MKNWHVNWLEDQLPVWVENSLVNEASAERIRAYYKAQENIKGTDFNIAFLVIGILGSLLIGVGIISIFAYKWTVFSVFTKTILGAIPVLLGLSIYVYAFFSKPNSRAWTEASAGFFALSLAASIGIISNTHRFFYTYEEGLVFIWLVLSLPLIYLRNATFPALLYLCGSMVFVANISADYRLVYWGLFAAIIPHFIRNKPLSKTTNRFALLGWSLVISMGFAWTQVWDMGVFWYAYFGMALAVVVTYMLGKIYYPNRSGIFHRPFQIAAVLFSYIVGLILSYDEFKVKKIDQLFDGVGNTAEWIGYIGFVIGLFWLISYVYLLVRTLRSSTRDVNFPILCFPMLILASIFLPCVLTMNLYVMALGIYYLYRGVRDRYTAEINLGMFFLIFQIFVHFVNSNLDLIAKGVVFIVLGLLFLSVNVYLSKRISTTRR